MQIPYLPRALDDVGADEAWVVAPVRAGYPLGRGARVAPLLEFLDRAGMGAQA